MLNSIMTVVTTNGEYVGKITGENSDSITMSDPRLIVTSETGMGFATGIAMTGTENPKTVTFKNYIFVTESSEGVVEAWNEHTGQIVVPSMSKIVGS